MKRGRITTLLVVVITLAVFSIPIIHMPPVPQVLSLSAPATDSSLLVSVVYLAEAGLVAGISPLFILASLFLGLLLFVYNRSRIPYYAKYYLVGVFVMAFAFEYQMTTPEGLDASMFNFQVILLMAVASILVAVIAQQISPGFAREAAKNETVKITYFIIIGGLVALVIHLYGGGAGSPVIAYASATGNHTLALIVYNLFGILPSIVLFLALGFTRFNVSTRFANDKERILLAGSILLFVSMLIIEVLSYLSGY